MSQQGLTKMSGVLNLPVLRELYLQENSISRIEGLNGCPRLQRIWLYGNKISRIDGLQTVGELRELWIQQVRLERSNSKSPHAYLANTATSTRRFGLPPAPPPVNRRIKSLALGDSRDSSTLRHLVWRGTKYPTTRTFSASPFCHRLSPCPLRTFISGLVLSRASTATETLPSVISSR